MSVVRYVTFGHDHERNDKREWVVTDGYAIFEAPSEELVYGLINLILGQKYAFSYSKNERPDRTEEGKRWYPKGSTAHIVLHFSTAYPSGWE